MFTECARACSYKRAHGNNAGAISAIKAKREAEKAAKAAAAAVAAAAGPTKLEMAKAAKPEALDVDSKKLGGRDE